MLGVLDDLPIHVARLSCEQWSVFKVQLEVDHVRPATFPNRNLLRFSDRVHSHPPLLQTKTFNTSIHIRESHPLCEKSLVCRTFVASTSWGGQYPFPRRSVSLPGEVSILSRGGQY